MFRKRDPESDGEEEVVGNLIDALCACLLLPELQVRAAMAIYIRVCGLMCISEYDPRACRYAFAGVGIRVSECAARISTCIVRMCGYTRIRMLPRACRYALSVCVGIRIS